MNKIIFDASIHLGQFNISDESSRIACKNSQVSISLLPASDIVGLISFNENSWIDHVIWSLPRESQDIFFKIISLLPQNYMPEYTTPNPEQRNEPRTIGADGLTDEQRKLVQDRFSLYNDEPIPPDKRREYNPQAAELATLYRDFEINHSLDELRKIIDLTPQEAPHHPLREPARQDLIPICKLLNILKDETNIPPEEYEKLYEQYKILAKAVGAIQKGKVIHK